MQYKSIKMIFNKKSNFIKTIREFYLQYLKKYLLFRLIRMLVFKIFSIKFDFIQYKFQLIAIDKYQEEFNLNRIKLLDELIIKNEPLKLCPDEYNKIYTIENSNLITMKDVYSYELLDVNIRGLSDFIYTNDKRYCIYDNQLDLDREITCEILHERISIDLNKNIAIRRDSLFSKNIFLNRGIKLSGCNTNNYVHWLTEFLPKLALLNNSNLYLDYPIIVDSNLHKNIYESIELLSNGRKIIFIDRDCMVKVKNLIYITNVGHAIFEFRNENVEKKVSDTIFHHDAINIMRKQIFSKLNIIPNPQNNILLKRHINTSRKAIGFDILEKYLVDENDFSVIEPMELSFSEQVKVFSTAKFVIGQNGAALGNLVFIPNDVKIIAFSLWSKKTLYYYFYNICRPITNKMITVICEDDTDLNNSKVHRDFNINYKLILNTYNKIVKEEG